VSPPLVAMGSGAPAPVPPTRKQHEEEQHNAEHEREECYHSAPPWCDSAPIPRV